MHVWNVHVECACQKFQNMTTTKETMALQICEECHGLTEINQDHNNAMGQNWGVPATSMMLFIIFWIIIITPYILPLLRKDCSCNHHSQVTNQCTQCANCVKCQEASNGVSYKQEMSLLVSWGGSRPCTTSSHYEAYPMPSWYTEDTRIHFLACTTTSKQSRHHWKVPIELLTSVHGCCLLQQTQ